VANGLLFGADRTAGSGDGVPVRGGGMGGERV